MSIKFLITIDTEGDNAWAKNGSEEHTENAKCLPRFQELCNRFKYKPTYLVSYEMSKDNYFIKFAKDILNEKGCEIGLHPHPWNQPPYFKLTTNDLQNHPYMIEYPEKIIREKIKILSNSLEDSLGIKMYSHRAGRWLFNEIYANILSEFGYLVDCSVTPYVKWPQPHRVTEDSIKVPFPDYSNFPSEPYYMDCKDISKSGKSHFLQLPMTIISKYGKIKSAMYNKVQNKNFRRAFRGILGQPVLWFRPTRDNLNEMLHMVKIKVKQRSSSYIMFMLHSSEFMAGGNPQFRNEKEINTLYQNLEIIFEHLATNNVQGATCYEFYQSFQQK